MNERKQLIKEIKQAPDSLVEEVLDFLLFAKNRKKISIGLAIAIWKGNLEKWLKIQRFSRKLMLLI